ncbi:MAG TPA: hypothetical protein VGA39_06295 [Candidatus Acidoferrales bacterium]
MLEGAAKNLAIRAGVAVLGAAVMLAWWTLRGDKGDSTTATESRIPARLWEGGGATLIIELETSEPTRVHASFGSNDRSLEADEDIAPGRHTWTLDLPADCIAFFSPSAKDPKVGARMSWTVTLNGRVLLEESETLEKPLEPNYAFGLTLEIEDVAELLSELEAERQE